jgi:sulfite reductase (NADPH) flavoprotein alpha-component
VNPNQLAFIPDSAPFTGEQRAWLNGFLAGLFAAPLTHQPEISQTPKPSLTILFGSQTGSAEQLAKKISGEAEKRGYAPAVLPMNDFAKIDLQRALRLLIVTSTWGEGDPPDNAVSFWQYLNSETAPKLDHLNFSVLALGDSSYSDFCGAGKKFDARLEELGAKRFCPRTDCDKDFESTANAWIETLWPALKTITGEGSAKPNGENLNPPAAISLSESLNGKTQSGIFTRTNPFPARLISNKKLNDGTKETRHFEISLEGSGLTYEAGDSLGVVPSNCSDLVSQIIQKLGCDGEAEVVNGSGNKTSLRAALQRDCEIHKISPQLLKIGSERNQGLRALLQPENKSQLDEYLSGRDALDLLTDFPAKFSPPEFIASLRKLSPRLYSIASSPKAHPSEIHLTVAIVRRETHGRVRKGICSTFLAERILEKTAVPIFVQSTSHFRLPKNPDVPVIMVGPGTGIAPFRAFLQERVAAGARGRNWLFFGHQHAATDFFYRDELLAAHQKGILTRLDTAFSRDQAEKIYVQHRLMENAKEVWSWLNEGAHFYVCGDASRMAKDVDTTLHAIAESAGELSKENAAAFVRDLRNSKRYQRDVY